MYSTSLITAGMRGSSRWLRRSWAHTLPCIPAPPLAALPVQIAAVQVVNDYDREVLNHKPPYRLRPEVFVGHDLRLLDPVREQRRRTFHGPEVDAAVLHHRVAHRLGAHPLADHAL